MDLSILIPSRNEEFLARTVKDVLENIEGETEILVALDGVWANPTLPQHPKLTIVYLPESIGQRASLNMLCRISKAKYVMKLDAHCSMGKGFDRILIEDIKDDWTILPRMYNMHVFDWKCKKCGNKWYQGRKPKNCRRPIKGFDHRQTNRKKFEDNPDCDSTEFEREMVWRPNNSPQTTAMRFDRNLKFQYWGGYKKKQEGDLVETMSILGACWMLTRKKYWELNICDEKHGSWGQQGTEVACKTWLSGGKLICDKRTWFAHLFRTQGGDFGFPYENDSVEQAREYSQDLWLKGKWKGKHTLQWLIDKFNPPDWESNKGIIYYTDNKLPKQLFELAKATIEAPSLPIVSASLKPMPNFGDNIHLPLERGRLTMFLQMYLALKRLQTEVVFFCEHDILYHPSHFEFNPPDDKFYYNTNVWKTDGKKALRVDNCRQVSGICVRREIALEHYKKRLKLIEKNGFSMKMGFEPATHNRDERVDDLKSGTWESEYPNIDVRHGGNLTATRWKKEEFRNQKYTEGWTESDEIEGWGKVNKLIK